MKITFYGTSHGVPSGDRFCSCYLLEVGGKSYLFDCGAPAIEKMLKGGKDLNSLKAVFLTHRHGDHTNSLINLVDLSNWYFKTMDYDIFVPEKELGDKIKDLIGYTSFVDVDEKRLRFKLASEDTFYDDGNIKVSGVRTQHLHLFDRPAYAFVVEAEGKKLLFTGDMSVGMKKDDFPAVAYSEKFDAIVCELAHFTLSEVAPSLEKAKTDRIIFTHVFPLSKYDDIEKAKNGFTAQIFTPNDDDEIEF